MVHRDCYGHTEGILEEGHSLPAENLEALLGFGEIEREQDIHMLLQQLECVHAPPQVLSRPLPRIAEVDEEQPPRAWQTFIARDLSGLVHDDTTSTHDTSITSKKKRDFFQFSNQ